MIRTGNTVKRDADGRRDYDTYEILYGLHPSIVKSSLRKFLGSYDYILKRKLVGKGSHCTLELINKHASLLVDRKLSRNSEDYFRQFTESLKQPNDADDFLRNPASRVSQAHWEFYNSL
jgi:hypothetical protein